jgi:peptide/nickel transport system substrate-binding protein
MPAFPAGRAHPRCRSIMRLMVALTLVSGLALYGPRVTSAQHRTSAPFVDLGTLTTADPSSVADLDPASNEDSDGANVERNMDGTLVTLAGASMVRFQPALATSWSVNADQSVYIFHLRHGVRFHTGRCCLTANDVKYSIARTMLAQLANAYLFSRFMSNPLKQIKVIDPYTVEFDLGRPQYFLLNALASVYIAQILDAQALKAHATKSDPWAHNWATDHDAGTGPYMLHSWARGQQLVLTRFPAFWGGWSGPHFSKIIVRTVPDSATRRELLERGQAGLTGALTPQDYDALKQNPKVRVVAPYGAEIDYIIMTEAGPLASPAARQALSYAFPYDALIRGIYRGYARRAYGPLPSTILGYDPHMFHYQTDLAKARALLQKAGVKPGTVLTFAYSDPFGKAAPLLQAQLAQLGITMKIEHLDAAAFNAIFFGSERASQRPNLMGFGWYPDYDDPYDACVPLVASYSAGANGVNGGFYHNAQVDALLAQMKNADHDTLVRDAYKLQDITGRLDPPAIWTDERADVVALASNVRGYVDNPVEAYTYDFYALHR